MTVTIIEWNNELTALALELLSDLLSLFVLLLVIPKRLQLLHESLFILAQLLLWKLCLDISPTHHMRELLAKEVLDTRINLIKVPHHSTLRSLWSRRSKDLLDWLVRQSIQLIEVHQIVASHLPSSWVL